jgi:hypothetical protein
MTAKNIHQRLHACMQAVDYIQKEKKAGMQYSIVTHDAVTAKVRPVLVEHGVLYYPVAMTRSQNGNRTEIDLTVRFANIDEPMDFIDVVACGYGVDTSDKGPGKAISYAVKYALLKALGLESGDDPDTESVAHEPERKASPRGPQATLDPFAQMKADAKRVAGLIAKAASLGDLDDITNDPIMDDIKKASELAYADLWARVKKRKLIIEQTPLSA